MTSENGLGYRKRVTLSKHKHDQEAAQTRRVNYEKPWFRQALKLIQETALSGCHALDLCCGNSEFSELIRDKFKLKVTCVDYIDTYVHNAQEKGFDAYQIDLDRVDGFDEFMRSHQSRFDIVVLLEAIKHVFDIDALLGFVHALLRPCGFLIISTPNIAFIGYRLYSLVNGNVPHGEGHHVRFFDEQRLREILFLSGFDSINMKTAHYDSTFPLDRICTPRNHIPWKLGKVCELALLNPLFRWLTPKSQRPAGLVVSVQRESVEPLSLSWQRCKAILEQTPGNRNHLIQRLKQGVVQKQHRSFGVE